MGNGLGHCAANNGLDSYNRLEFCARAAQSSENKLYLVKCIYIDDDFNKVWQHYNDAPKIWKTDRCDLNESLN